MKYLPSTILRRIRRGGRRSRLGRILRGTLYVKLGLAAALGLAAGLLYLRLSAAPLTFEGLSERPRLERRAEGLGFRPRGGLRRASDRGARGSQPRWPPRAALARRRRQHRCEVAPDRHVAAARDRVPRSPGPRRPQPRR